MLERRKTLRKRRDPRFKKRIRESPQLRRRLPILRLQKTEYLIVNGLHRSRRRAGARRRPDWSASHSLRPTYERRSRDSLKRRYRAALALIAFLVLLNQLLVQPALLRLTTDPRVMNIAGRQRMLSQRLAKAALAFERANGEDPVAPPPRAGPGRHAVVELRTTALRHGNVRCRCRAGISQARRRRARGPGAALRADASVGQAIDPGRRGEPDRRRAAAADDLAMILGAEAEYLERMDESSGCSSAKRRTEWPGCSGPAGSWRA